MTIPDWRRRSHSAKHLSSIISNLCEASWRKHHKMDRQEAPVTLRALTATDVMVALSRLARFERDAAKRSPPELCYIPLVVCASHPLPAPPKD